MSKTLALITISPGPVTAADPLQGVRQAEVYEIALGLKGAASSFDQILYPKDMLGAQQAADIISSVGANMLPGFNASAADEPVSHHTNNLLEADWLTSEGVLNLKEILNASLDDASKICLVADQTVIEQAHHAVGFNLPKTQYVVGASALQFSADKWSLVTNDNVSSSVVMRPEQAARYYQTGPLMQQIEKHLSR
ncbi:MAG: hypothetical protein AB8B83_07840 [Bdellovibrionales bacterium]